MTAFVSDSLAVARTALRLRFGRSSTWVLFLLLCATAFLLMPDVGTNAVMFLIKGRRTLLNSAATSLTSALLGGFVLSLFGFYLISDAVTRDDRTGVGRLLAPAPISSTSYLAGVFLGNTVFLYAISAIFMCACMVVHAIRGEAALEPLVFGWTFGLMFLPLAPALASLALVFECVPALSGRLGDVAYFLLWTTLLALPAALISTAQAPSWILAFDLTGSGFFLSNIVHVTGATNFTIGYAPYDPSLAPVAFPGLDLDPSLITPRVCSALLALPLCGIARLAFQRFDPARRHRRRRDSALLVRLTQSIAPSRLTLPAPPAGWITGTPQLWKAILLDARLTMVLSPFAMEVFLAASLCGLLMPATDVRTIVMPVLMFLVVPILSTISTRDRRANAAQLVFTTPLLQQNFVLVKLLSAFTTVLVLSIVPGIHLAIDNPVSIAALLGGMMFVAAAATFFGITTGTPKTFVVLFLLFLYIGQSSRTAPAFDFAGLAGLTTAGIAGGYLAVTILLIAGTVAAERWTQSTESYH